MTDWNAILKKIAPTAKASVVSQIAPYLEDAFGRYEIDTPLRQAHFLAQMAHESAHFRTLTEYWGPTAAQKRYEGRKDLGNVQRGDGKRFMGRGIIQVTGRANYRKYGRALGLDLEANPEQAATGKIAVEIACLYWRDKKLNAKADRDDVRGITKAINGGYNGLADRQLLLAKAKRCLPDFSTRLGILSQPEPEEPQTIADVEAEKLAEPAFGMTEDAIREAQCKLRDLGYYEVGMADGKIGPSTRAAITAFRDQEDLPPGKEFDVDVLRALETANPRQIAKERSEATSQEIARVAPEAKSALMTRMTAKVQTIGFGGTAVVAGLADQVSEVTDALNPFKRFFGAVPIWVWILLAAAGAGFLWWRAQQTTEEVKTAYQTGARR